MADILLGDLRDIWRDNKDAAEAVETILNNEDFAQETTLSSIDEKVATETTLDTRLSSLETKMDTLLNSQDEDNNITTKQTGSIVVIKGTFTVSANSDKDVFGELSHPLINGDFLDIKNYEYITIIIRRHEDSEDHLFSQSTVSSQRVGPNRETIRPNFTDSNIEDYARKFEFNSEDGKDHPSGVKRDMRIFDLFLFGEELRYRIDNEDDQEHKYYAIFRLK